MTFADNRRFTRAERQPAGSGGSLPRLWHNRHPYADVAGNPGDPGEHQHSSSGGIPLPRSTFASGQDLVEMTFDPRYDLHPNPRPSKQLGTVCT